MKPIKELEVIYKRYDDPSLSMIERDDGITIFISEDRRFYFEKGYFKLDIKEFIELLKAFNMEIGVHNKRDWHQEIDKLAGKSFA